MLACLTIQKKEIEKLKKLYELYFSRRGSALAELGFHDEAIIEFEEASKLMPERKEDILQNVEKIKTIRKGLIES